MALLHRAVFRSAGRSGFRCAARRALAVSSPDELPSKHVPDGKLHNPWADIRLDPPEISVVQSRHGIQKVRPILDIECFATDLELFLLRQPETSRQSGV